jgi:hypothetical protein
MTVMQHLATQAAFVANVRKLKYAYPKEKIDESWEKVLLNQFHDGELVRREDSSSTNYNVVFQFFRDPLCKTLVTLCLLFWLTACQWYGLRRCREAVRGDPAGQ